MSFVNSSLASLVSSLNVSVLGGKPNGGVVYSKFNLKILLFLVSRGYLSELKVLSNRGPGAIIQFKLSNNTSGIPVFRKISSPYLNRGFGSQKLVKFQSYRGLSLLYSSEFVVVSTKYGLMTSGEAIRLRVGGLVVLVIT